ncbi:MAG: D-alanyl-D-alanine carboxypeptidase (penicillin-binding protein 5/6) [Parcubacteria group bacterium Gr01-1014_106]|nr:MAG: D-alanyl-D-alanine carboxypeptidase (penicillin-binding protein 5/6) [Parcubacteria group bacterium Gr01-1014_106]
MLVQLLTAAIALFLNAPPPESLDDPGRVLSAVAPEGRVLLAEAIPASGEGPRLVQETLGPALHAGSFLVVDVTTGRVLTAREPSAIRPVASLTKLLTALTVLRNANVETEVTASTHAVSAGRGGADAKLRAGEQFTVRDLLAALLITSANDAAVALAEHVSGNEAAFAERMEETARALGLTRTRMENATGFDTAKHFSTASDVATALTSAWQDPVLGPFLRMEELTITSRRGKSHRLRTTNRLLGIRADILGGKTGFTEAAGENLAVMAESPDHHVVAAVVLGSTDRFADMDNLLNWTFWAYEWPKETQTPPNE